MSFRVEEKIVLTPYECSELTAELERRGMTTLYPARRIRSVYFETPDLRMFRDSEEGVLPRRKIRLRHYPSDPDAGWTLETKISSIEGRFKSARKKDEAAALSLMSSGLFDRQYGLLHPRLAVEYERRYYRLQGLRVTFDRDIRYSTPGGQHCRSEDWTVCELKAPADASLDEIVRLVDAPRRRFSKFCNGIAALSDIVLQ